MNDFEPVTVSPEGRWESVNGVPVWYDDGVRRTIGTVAEGHYSRRLDAEAALVSLIERAEAADRPVPEGADPEFDAALARTRNDPNLLNLSQVLVYLDAMMRGTADRDAVAAFLREASDGDMADYPADVSLPTMTGAEIAQALHEGKNVQTHFTPSSPCGGGPLWQGAGDKDFWYDQCRGHSIVARIAEPPEPATRSIRADELRVGMRRPDSEMIVRIEHFAAPFRGVRWQTDATVNDEWSNMYTVNAPVLVLVDGDNE